MTTFDPVPLRAQFPALSMAQNERPLAFFDSPGGTQTPRSVIEAISDCLANRNANLGGAFLTSTRADEVVLSARCAMADLLNAPGPESVVFGQNMTSLAFHLSRALRRALKPGDAVAVTNLDHDANVAPWMELAEAGAEIRVVDILTDDCTLDEVSLERALAGGMALLAVTAASNAVGTLPDVKRIVRHAHAAGALVFVDAVQAAPHIGLDVQDLDCDFLACSAYKFFGPHVGVLYGKTRLMESLRPSKVRPAPESLPWRWETGTQNHEGLAGVEAAVNYLARVAEDSGNDTPAFAAEGGDGTRREKLTRSFEAIRRYEEKLCARLLDGLQRIRGLKVFGIKDHQRLRERVPTVALNLRDQAPDGVAEKLAAAGICVWSGNYYAIRLMERLGLQPTGGAVRVGLTHLNTAAEVDRLLEELDRIAA